MIQFPMEKISITAPFGPYTVAGVRKPHNGCDICNQSNTSVVAAHAGKVILSAWDSGGGNMLVINGGFNEELDIVTRYAHLASRRVAAGDTVAQGQLVGIQGATGAQCFGQHLHFETWLVPKGYSYSFADRARYSVDPLSVCHVVSGQRFVCDDDTFFKKGVPYPEPVPDKLQRLSGAKLTVMDGAVALRMVPFTEYTALVGESGSRSKDTLGEWVSEREFPALCRCSTVTEGVRNDWALICTRLGSWWTAVIPGFTKLEGTDTGEVLEREADIERDRAVSAIKQIKAIADQF